MTARKWIDDGYQTTELRDVRRIRWVLIATMLLNFLATAIKLAAGLATGALSVVADGLDSLFDGISNLAGLVGLNLASQPPDVDHPYGHRKFETIAALSIAFLLFLTSWQLLQTAWERWWSDAVPDINIWTALALVISMLIQAGTSAEGVTSPSSEPGLDTANPVGLESAGSTDGAGGSAGTTEPQGAATGPGAEAGAPQTAVRPRAADRIRAQQPARQPG